MAVTITRNDLLAKIGKEELDGLSLEATEVGQPDPVETSIEEGLAVIRLYIDPFTLREDALKRFWTILAVAWIYNRLSRIPKKRKEEQEWAISVLEDIRDGKFKNLLLDEEIVAELEDSGGSGTWGSQGKFEFPRP